MKPKTNDVSGNSSKKRKQHSPFRKFLMTVTKILIVFMIALGCALAGIVGGAILGYIRTANPLTPDQLMLKGLTTNVYDMKGTAFEQIKGEKNRELVDIGDIPKYLQDAFVAIEDERFFSHKGIDLKRIAGSAIRTLQGTRQGGSTITQQLVRNLTGNTEISLKRKIQEQYQAIELERKLEKWQILELYMNLIYMGYNYYGVESASKAYFGKPVKELSLAECASLAGITNAPALLDPFTTKGRENNIERQRIILKKMLETGAIKQQEYDQALRESLKFADSDKSSGKKVSNQSYFVEQVINDVQNDLMTKYGLSRQAASNMIFNQGLKVYATVDSDVQKGMDTVFKDDKLFPIVNKNAEHPQAAMVVMDSKTGQLRGIYGGYGEKKADMVLNRATQMKRQPGSSFKPIAVYGPAINERKITAATVVDDAPVYMNTDKKDEMYPKNYESGTYSGLTPIRDAIRESKNVVAAKVWKDLLGPDLSLQYLKKVGINRDKERYVSLALGGLSEGVNPLQMANAYIPFVNKGMFIEGSTYTKVEDKDGKVLLEKKPKTSIVYDEAASYIMTNMMEDVTKLGTAYPYGLIQDGKMPTAGKTGTTNDYKDKWFVGYSPYYIGATWYGYDKPITLVQPEYDSALKIWHDVMEKAHKGLNPIEFPEPPGIVRKDFCMVSGKVASSICFQDPRGANAIRYGEVFIKGTEPKDGDICDVHVSAKVDKDAKDILGRNLLAGPYCPPSSIIEKVFIQRKVPFSPRNPEDPYPQDWIYELPAGEYCNIHGPGATPFPSNGKSNGTSGSTTAKPGISPSPTSPPFPSLDDTVKKTTPPGGNSANSTKLN